LQYKLNLQYLKHFENYFYEGANNSTKEVPTKVHLVSHTYMIQGFVSDGLYLMV